MHNFAGASCNILLFHMINILFQDSSSSSILKLTVQNAMKDQQICNIIIHWTHDLFSDWPKAYSEFSKSAPGTSSSWRLYNNQVKDTQGHG